MTLQIDTKKKTGAERVLHERVPLVISGKTYNYFMTNDYASISDRLRSFGCRPPLAEDLSLNRELAKNVRAKMQELGVCWAMTVCNGVSVLNYHDASSGEFFIVFLHVLFPGEIPFCAPLHVILAINNKSRELEEVFKESYGNVDIRSLKGATPLMFAAAAGACNSIRTLLNLGADVNAVDSNGMAALGYAALMNSTAAAKILLAADGLSTEARDYMGNTVLLLAASHDFTEMCSMLIDAGANINATNYIGNTALTMAVSKGADRTAELLVSLGADVNTTDNWGRTPLIIAAEHDNAALVKKMLKAGADIHSKNKQGHSALIAAAQKDAAKVIDYFMQEELFSGAELENALIKAAMQGFVNSTDVIIRRSKNQGRAAYAALVSASFKNRAAVINICMNYPCNVNDGIYFGMTPLMLASYSNAEDAAKSLIAHGADVNSADKDGITALMYAAMKNNPKMIVLLCKNGADRNMKDAAGKSFEDYAGAFTEKSFSQMLIDRIKAKNPDLAEERKDDIPKERQSFNDRFTWYKEKYFERFPNNENSDLYRAAGLTKQTFSKILSNRNPNFRPKKNTVIALSLGLKLTLNESEDLLQCAGYTFLPTDKTDIEVKRLLSEKNYDLFDWGSKIYESTGRAFFRTMMGDEDD